ncbi:hypothetical protein ACNI65_25340 [Roseateles sp. So40a]|uniref:hypothetical protein n=1 Tax=Roseateles sp. So40a TaxID=3400226 RepID=UPI003A8829BA
MKHKLVGAITRLGAAALLSATGITLSLAAEPPKDFSQARANWEAHKDSAEYQKYADEFVQFNNHFHLDEKGGCYQLSPGPVELMLVITHTKGDQFATIERVISDSDSAKAQCFKRTYKGIATKVPPYLPFVFSMRMG